MKGAAGRGKGRLLFYSLPYEVSDVARRLMRSISRSVFAKCARSLAQTDQTLDLGAERCLNPEFFFLPSTDSMASEAFDRPHHHCLARVRGRPDRLSRGRPSTGVFCFSGGTWPASACTSPVFNSPVSRSEPMIACHFQLTMILRGPGIAIASPPSSPHQCLDGAHCGRPRVADRRTA
ncbi:hypothetical protein HDV57DRAFT_110115 [Trichoderma longibrachiatum]|uniref:Uncharacterized protein n=1 Tax=Trichoderma longibrachiatum ATCC 18648 TaxID=983965 RepID=A0A2T4BQU0_TRILO|nr:hypothetical protein M440DRAFT_1145112 [Trichoderma longibrachiatum ATCC 18648]